MKKALLILSMFAASALTAAEQTHSWFDTELPKIWGERQTRSWPTDGSDYEGFECVITNTAAGEDVDERIVFDAERPMAVCPYLEDHVTGGRRANPASVEGDHTVDVFASMKLTPFPVSSLPPVPAGTKAAVIAVDEGEVTNFWVTAGVDELFWTNTLIEADVTRVVNVNVSMRTNDVNSTVTDWTLDRVPFHCEVTKFTQVNGVSFTGRGELANCYGDRDVGVTFVSFWFEPIPEDVIVSVTDAFGAEIPLSSIGDYECREGATVSVVYSLPAGWRFYDGATYREESFTVQQGPRKPMYDPEFPEVSGIMEADIGPEDGWMLLRIGEFGPELVGRFARLDDTLATMKDGCGLVQCYSEFGHLVEVAGDGSGIEVDGETYPAKDHYLYIDFDGLPMLTIDPREAAVVSFGEDPEDPTRMSLGSVEESVPDFSYSVIWADDFFFSEDPGESEPRPGNGGRLELKAPKGDRGGRFYMIRVSDDF